MATGKPDLEFTHFNGLDGASGDYLIPPLSVELVAKMARGEQFAPADLAEFAWRGAQGAAHYGLSEGIDADDLAQAGWGVIFAEDANPTVKEALNELLLHRGEQAGGRYQEFSGPDGFRHGDTKNGFLGRMGSGPGPVDPDRVPYYLLIVGDPASIPFSFQTQLDVAYAVGRIHFNTLDDYARYAHGVVLAETSLTQPSRRAVFFGASNPHDEATHATATRLVAPLAGELRDRIGAWQVEAVLGREATKDRLSELLNEDAPALLFTASHGVGFPMDDARQYGQQGALVCQDWPGREATQGRGIQPQWCFGADDVAPHACLLGTVVFAFACFGAGTPQFDEFAHLRTGVRERAQIAPAPFIAQLPKRLLALPAGGALAVIGHIDRAWTSSFMWDQAGAQLSVFESTLRRLMDGRRVGYAMEYFNQRYAELSTLLSSELEEIKFGKLPDPRELARVWMANNDARGYAVIGDPAARIHTRDVEPQAH